MYLQERASCPAMESVVSWILKFYNNFQANSMLFLSLLSQWLSKVLLVESPLFNCQWPVSHDQASPSEALLMQTIFSLKFSISWSAMQHYFSPTQLQFAPFFFPRSHYSPNYYILLLITSVSEYGSLQMPGIYYTRSHLRKF